jgi:hypothetical protein
LLGNANNGFGAKLIIDKNASLCHPFNSGGESGAFLIVEKVIIKNKKLWIT